MVQRLQASPTRIIDLAAPFDMSLPAISKHVRVLESAGLVTRSKVGRESTIHLQSDSISLAISWLERHRRLWNDSFDHLEKFLQSKPQPKTKSKRKELKK